MKVEKVPILRVTKDGEEETETAITIELPLTIRLNKQEVVTLLCSPMNLDCLAVGYLFSEGLLKSKDEIKEIAVDEQRGIVQVDTKVADELPYERIHKPLIASGGGQGATFDNIAELSGQAKIESRVVVSPDEVFKLAGEFERYSQLFQTTRGVHSAALCDNEKILVFKDDLGRHNAIDKVSGECILKDIPTDDRIIITTGRVPSEQLLKVAKMRVPIMVSLTVPTDLGVKLADDFGMTLIGSVKSGKMNIYTNRWRVVAK